MTNKRIIHQPIQPEIQELAAEYGNDSESILSILTRLQELHGSLSPEIITDAARALSVPAHQAYGMATFYSMLFLEPRKQIVHVCDGPVCWTKNAAETHKAIEAIANDDWTVERASCLGLCDSAPAVLVNNEQAGPVLPEDAAKLLEGWRGAPNGYATPRRGEVRAMMANAGKVDPKSIDSALEHGVYDGLKKALGMTPEAVVAVMDASGLQGRGGAGFPVGRKWEFVAQARNTPKYVICNADESEPLIFKDRVLIETNPHQILAGMAIAGYACGASEAFIYIRGEYAAQARLLEGAIEQAEEKGWLGDNIQGSGFSLHVHVHRGAGAYICGEETALIESLEGKRGEPRLRPPYPPTAGYRGLPTLVNNVESFAAAANIVRNGADWWRSLSDYETPGTKLYILLGPVENPGLFEAPFGLTLRQIIDEFGGGMLPGSEFRCALTGGAAGTIVDETLLDVPIDYASGSRYGISLGAGAFMVCDQTTSPVALLQVLLHFFAAESCGKCTPCRVGTWRSKEILTRMVNGQGRPGDVEELKALADHLQSASFCGLGQSAGVPMNSAIQHFAQAFEQAANA